MLRKPYNYSHHPKACEARGMPFKCLSFAQSTGHLIPVPNIENMTLHKQFTMCYQKYAPLHNTDDKLTSYRAFNQP
jgi:hypothetical protein